MAKKNNIALFNINGCLTREALLAYLQKSLEDRDLKKVQEHLDTCPLCSDAAEGITGIAPAVFNNDINKLKISLSEKSTTAKKMRRLRYLSYAAAAASVLIIISVLLMYRQVILPGKDNIAFEQSKEKVPEEIPNIINIEEPETEAAEIKKPAMKEAARTITQEPLSDKRDNIEMYEEEIMVETEGEETVVPEKEEDETETTPALRQTTPLPLTLQSAGNDMINEEKVKDQNLKSEMISANYATEQQSGKAIAEYTANGYKKKKPQPGSDDYVFTLTSQMPVFEGGGPEKFYSYLIDTLKRNELFLQSGFTEKILMNYTIDTSGRVVDIKLLNITDQNMQEEIINIIKYAPRWLPGMQNGKKVNVSFAASLDTNP